MADVTARTKVKGKNYEILVDLDEALKIKAGAGDIMSALKSQGIYRDLKNPEIIPRKELEEAFGTFEVYAIAKQIILKGEVQKNQEFRDAEREKRIKQVVTLIVRNAVDQHNHPYTEDRIKRAIEEAHVPIDNRSAEQQLPHIVLKLTAVIPIRLSVKRYKLTIPASYTGHTYGLLQEYKESEEWLANGSLQVVMSIPAGMVLDFFDKLNSVTHGALQSEELPEK